MDSEMYYMWLSRINGLGLKKQEILLEKFGHPKEILNAPKEEITKIKLLGEHVIANILKSQDNDLLNQYCNQLNEKNIRFISKFNKEYPSLLKEIPDPPLGLYFIGEFPDDNLPKLSVIGSRRCSEYGLTVSHKLSKEAGANNIVVVSGMATGIDSMSHKGAIEGGGFTIAVLGCGVDICYPPENKNLREQIIKNGCIISEYPPNTIPMPVYFPPRNRIISGLSNATLVVEAGKKSGTLITVDRALEQGRDVYVIPGNITSKLSEGTNNLIKQGAIVITCLEDIINNLGIITFYNEENKNEQANNKLISSLDENERLVYDCISSEPITVDYIINKLNMQTNVCNYILVTLELKGIIKKIPGQKYILSY